MKCHQGLHNLPRQNHNLWPLVIYNGPSLLLYIALWKNSIDLFYINCWIPVYKWSVMDKQVTRTPLPPKILGDGGWGYWLPLYTLLTIYRWGNQQLCRHGDWGGKGLTVKAPITAAADDNFWVIFINFRKNKAWYYMRIVCQQTILMKYHVLFVIFEKATKFEIVVCCKL